MEGRDGVIEIPALRIQVVLQGASHQMIAATVLSLLSARAQSKYFHLLPLL